MIRMDVGVDDVSNRLPSRRSSRLRRTLVAHLRTAAIYKSHTFRELERRNVAARSTQHGRCSRNLGDANLARCICARRAGRSSRRCRSGTRRRGLPAVVGACGRSPSSRCFEREVISLRKLAVHLRVRAWQVMWDHAFWPLDFSDHLAGIRRDVLVQIEFVVGRADEWLCQVEPGRSQS